MDHASGWRFTFVISAWHGGAAAGEYLSGYLIEKSLSIDNVFVWAVIFSYFAVPAAYQFRVLFWGIFGALVLRAVFIFAGVALHRGVRAGSSTCSARSCSSPRCGSPATRRRPRCTRSNNPVLGWCAGSCRRPPSTTARSCSPGGPGACSATPLFAVLILIETTDVVFAVDSIPAILAVSREPFIVFSSNAFAILGLRALYFCLAGMADASATCNLGLGVILAFVGIKMLLVECIHFSDVAQPQRDRGRPDRHDPGQPAGRPS